MQQKRRILRPTSAAAAQLEPGRKREEKKTKKKLASQAKKQCEESETNGLDEVYKTLHCSEGFCDQHGAFVRFSDPDNKSEDQPEG